MNIPPPIIERFPEYKHILLELPLYKEIDLTNHTLDQITNFEGFKGSVDSYCIDCERESVFWVALRPHFEEPNQQAFSTNYIDIIKLMPRSFYFMMTCSRNKSHLLIFYFKIYNGKLVKVGQFPSIADLQFRDVEKYRKVLSKERFRDFTRGIGLASHGVGVGSFVYLRRIFEDLIEEAHQKLSTQSDWNEEIYKRSRMDEKIQLLQPELPNFLVENRTLYGILSVGIHELSENQCLEYFPTVKLGIELILDEKLTEKLKQQKIELAKKSINQIHGDLTKQD